MEKGPPPEGGNMDRGPSAVALLWATVAISSVVVTLRFVGRIMVRSVGWDDWTMLFTLCLYILFAAFLTHDAAIGGMRHLYYLSAAETVEALRWSWISQPWVIMGYAFGKTSVGLLLLRIIGPNTFWRRWLLYFLMSSAFILSAIDVILTFAQCTPVDALWNPMLLQTGQATCWNSSIQTNFAIFLSSWNVLVDTILALLPATIFWKLNLGWRKKLGLSMLLGLGITAAVCAAIKTTYLAALNARSDLTWETYNLYVWSGAELFVVICCGSAPPIKPIFDWLFPRAQTAGSGSAYRKYGSHGSSLQKSQGSRRDPSGLEKGQAGLESDSSRRHLANTHVVGSRDPSYDIERFPHVLVTHDVHVSSTRQTQHSQICDLPIQHPSPRSSTPSGATTPPGGGTPPNNI